MTVMTVDSAQIEQQRDCNSSLDNAIVVRLRGKQQTLGQSSSISEEGMLKV